MSAADYVVYGSLLLLLFAYMVYLSWRNENLIAILTAPFANGGTKGVAGGVLLIASLEWFVHGWSTTFTVAAVAFAIALFFIGRRAERLHNQLNS